LNAWRDGVTRMRWKVAGGAAAVPLPVEEQVGVP